MDTLPKVAMLGYGVDWNHQNFNKIQLGHMQSFCNDHSLFDDGSNGAAMLSAFSSSLDTNVYLNIGKVISGNDEMSLQGFARAIIWAAECQPDVVVIPVGVDRPNSVIKSALEILFNTQCEIFATTGNPETGISNSLYPAAYPECIAIGCDRYTAQYNEWRAKPDIMLQESTLNSAGVTYKELGSATATILAAAEYLNGTYSAGADYVHRVYGDPKLM